MRLRLPDFFVRVGTLKTDNLIAFLFYKSKEMYFNKQDDIFISAIGYKDGIRFRGKIGYSSWDLLSIVYYSILRGTDKNRRILSTEQEFAELINSYRIFENENCNAGNSIKNADMFGIFKFMAGITSEQFLYHDFKWVLEYLNRNYYMLEVIAKEIDSPIKIDSIVSEMFGMTADQFISSILIVFWLCMQHPNILDAPEDLYRKKAGTILKKENITKVVNYYSINYEGVRTSTLGKQIFYSKPFVVTESGKTLATHFGLVNMLVSNCLYWIPRNYFAIKNDQTFTNSFGKLFEIYVERVLKQYLDSEEYHKIPESSEKSADYILTLDNYIILVEVKSTLLALSGKQQEPDEESINNFCNRALAKAYDQLNNSKAALTSDKPVIKFILLYENLKNTSLFERAIDEIENDKYCNIVTIYEFETLLSLFRTQKEKFNNIVNRIFEHEKKQSNPSILQLLEDEKIFQNDFIHRIDHWGTYLKNLHKELE